MAKKTITITEGRKELFNIAEEVQKPDTQYVLTREGKPKIVLMSADEYDSMLETMEILSDPKTLADIRDAEKEIERGEYVTWEQVKKDFNFLPNKNLVLKEKPKRKYSAHSKKKR